METNFQRQPGSKSVLGASGARFWGHFGDQFELPNRSKNDTENKLNFKRFWAPLEISESGSVRVIMACFGPGGGLNWGEETSLIVSMYQSIKDSKTVGINLSI